MKKSISLIYYITVVTSALVGLWHFFVPWMFQWYDYLPMQYENLIASVLLVILMVFVSVYFMKMRKKMKSQGCFRM